MMGATSFSEDGQTFEVFECDLDSDRDIELEEAGRLLSHEEHTRAGGFVFQSDRDRFVRGRGFTRRVLGAYLGKDPEKVIIDTSAGGKPQVRGGGINFNLSHSGGYLVVVVTNGPAVGIDIEVADRNDSLEHELSDLAGACLTPNEQSELFRTPASERKKRFLTYWTAKEARMKLHGEGFSLEPKSVALELDGGTPIGYLQPTKPQSKLRFVQLCAPAVICCLAFGISA